MHSKNADEIAKFLMDHPKVERVVHPSVASDLAKERADKYLSGGCGGLHIHHLNIYQLFP